MNENEIRRDQQQEGQRRTLTTKPGYSQQRSGGPKKPFVAKGHDAILKRIQDAGGLIAITVSSDGSVIKGRLAARDKFTITVEVRKEGEPDRLVTIYKHAIESFCGVE